RSETSHRRLTSHRFDRLLDAGAVVVTGDHDSDGRSEWHCRQKLLAGKRGVIRQLWHKVDASSFDRKRPIGTPMSGSHCQKPAGRPSSCPRELRTKAETSPR